MHRWLLLLFLSATALIYAKGLEGPFLLDDHIHISQNRWVKIDVLDWPSVKQAWNSSFSAFPGNRPLAQLTFGINHALTGLDPWYFKATNLVIHLLTGLAVFIFVRLCCIALSGGSPDRRAADLVALAAAGFWLLAPLHVSTVLYTVQRMAQLSTLALLLALSAYLSGRLRISSGKPGGRWFLMTILVAGVGFFGKENVVLLPLLLLAMEVTVLRQVGTGQQRYMVYGVWLSLIAIPMLVGSIYFFTHPALLYYDHRPFDLVERVLTESRVLWFYLRLLLVPDPTAFSLFHDDLPLSTDLISPPTTLVAVIGWLSALSGAILARRRLPVFSFAVLFFLAAHALESTVISLELVFEHRNYLASVGPLFLLSHLIVVTARRAGVARLAAILGTLLLLSYGAVTYLRVDDWRSYKQFVLSSAENHPGSPRANFMAAQFLISGLSNGKDGDKDVSTAAEILLLRGLEADVRCINCLFGLVVLDLHQGRQPAPELLTRLADSLRSGFVGPTKVSVSQFGYLVRWQRSGGVKIPSANLESIFDAALSNPAWIHSARAGIEAAYREYHEFVTGDLESALTHAEAAVAAWPTQWSYHKQLADVLRKLGRNEQALAVLDRAAAIVSNASQRQQTAEMRAEIEQELSDQ